MKLTKTASGKTKIKMSRSEWTDMGKKAGWMKEAVMGEDSQAEQPNQTQTTPSPTGPFETFSAPEQKDIENLLKGYKDLYDVCEGIMGSTKDKFPRWFVENVQNSYRVIGSFQENYSSRGRGTWSEEDGPYIPDHHKWASGHNNNNNNNK